MATIEGSFMTMPSPRTYTRVLAVPRSMARSLEKRPARKLSNMVMHSHLVATELDRTTTPARVYHFPASPNKIPYVSDRMASTDHSGSAKSPAWQAPNLFAYLSP